MITIDNIVDTSKNFTGDPYHISSKNTQALNTTNIEIDKDFIIKCGEIFKKLKILDKRSIF